MAADGGYAASRLNAVTHGIFRSVDLLTGDDRAAFTALHAALVEDHRPVGAQEELWVRDLAIQEWRLGLCFAAETALFAAPVDADGEAYTDDGGLETRGQRALAALDDPRMMKLLRYQTTFDRARKRTTDMLAARQAARHRREERRPEPRPQLAPTVQAAASLPVSPETRGRAEERLEDAAANMLPAAPPPTTAEKPAGEALAEPTPEPVRGLAGFVALARERARQIEDALAVIAARGAAGYDAALARLEPRMRRWWEERLAGGRGVGDSAFDIETWERRWIGKPTAAGLRDWLNALRWSDRELTRHPG